MPSPKPPFLLTVGQLRRLSPHFPLSHGVPRVDDRRVVSGIIYVIRHGLQWRDAPAAYGPHKTLYNRFVRWSRLGVFDRIFAALAAEGGVIIRRVPRLFDLHAVLGAMFCCFFQFQGSNS
jgi:transposase